MENKDGKSKENEEFVRCRTEQSNKLEDYKYKKFIAVMFIAIVLMIASIYTFIVTGEKHTSILGITVGCLITLCYNLVINWYNITTNTKTISSFLILGSLITCYNFLYNERFDEFFWLNLSNTKFYSIQ